MNVHFFRNECDNVAAGLRKNRILAEAYHAGLSDSDRIDVQDKWQNDRCKVSHHLIGQYFIDHLLIGYHLIGYLLIDQYLIGCVFIGHQLIGHSLIGHLLIGRPLIGHHVIGSSDGLSSDRL